MALPVFGEDGQALDLSAGYLGEFTLPPLSCVSDQQQD
jgi:hypothetical protein